MKRCMIVDDSNVICKVAKRILAGPEMMVAEAGTAGEALSMCMADLPDIIMVDSGLPDMDSIEFIRRVMAIDPQFRPQIVICLIQFDVGTIMRAKRAGACGYILKPFSRTQLLERFRDMDLAA